MKMSELVRALSDHPDILGCKTTYVRLTFGAKGTSQFRTRAENDYENYSWAIT